MKSLIKYQKVFILGIQSSMEYRVNFFLSIVSTFFPVFIQFFLWTAVYANATNEIIYGYTFEQMLTYTFLAGIVSKVVATGFEQGISGEIKDGGLNKFIVQPIKYSFYKICDFLGQKVMQLVIMLGISAVILVLLHHYLGLVIEFRRVILFILTLILSLVLNFLISFALSTVAFWTSETWGIFGSFAVIGNIASGGIFPIDIFGEKLQALLGVLPFQYTIYYPINILNGRLEWSNIFQGMVIQMVWIFIMMILSKILWKIGTRKYIAAGG